LSLQTDGQLWELAITWFFNFLFLGSWRPKPSLMLEEVWESLLPWPEWFPSGWQETKISSCYTSLTGRNPFRLMRLLHLINQKVK
jgi:hypothetical protein